MKTKTYVKGVAALCALAAVACTGVQQSRGDVAVYLDESQPLEKRVEDALSRMTLEEKVGLLHARLNSHRRASRGWASPKSCSFISATNSRRSRVP